MREISFLTILLCIGNFCLSQVTITANASNSSVCPGNSSKLSAELVPATADPVTYSWSPASELSASTGSSVIATPSSTTTYTVTFINLVTSETGSANVTVTVNPDCFLVLPIKLEYLKGLKMDKNNKLVWKVNCTSGSAKFEIERSNNGINYTSIKTISADQARCSAPFDYTDVHSLNGKNYYRIKITDETGAFQYSNTVTLNSNLSKFEIIGMHPNIVMGDATIKINGLERNELFIQVKGIDGRVQFQQTEILRSGANAINLKTSLLSSGSYIIYAYMPGEEPQKLQFIKR